MSTHGTPRPSGSTYYGASYRAQEPPGLPPAPGPGPGPGFAPPGPGFAPPWPSPVPTLAPSGGDSFPPMDTSGFGAGPPPGTGYAVPGQGGPAAPPARRNSGLPIVLGVLTVVLALCLGGGAAAYFFFIADESSADEADRPAAATSPAGTGSGTATPAPASATPSGTKQPGGGEEEVSGDLSGYKQGDCLTVDQADDNKVEKVKCTDPGAQKVLLRKNGTLDDSACESTDATFSLSQDAPGSTKDFVLCVGPVD